MKIVYFTSLELLKVLAQIYAETTNKLIVYVSETTRILPFCEREVLYCITEESEKNSFFTEQDTLFRLHSKKNDYVEQCNILSQYIRKHSLSPSMSVKTLLNYPESLITNLYINKKLDLNNVHNNSVIFPIDASMSDKNALYFSILISMIRKGVVDLKLIDAFTDQDRLSRYLISKYAKKNELSKGMTEEKTK